MRRLAQSALALALTAAVAFSLASCGGGEDPQLLPGRTAREIDENLDRVKQLAGEGECVGAANEAQEVSVQVESLGDVDAKLKQALQQGTARLNEVIATCEEATTEAVEPPTEETTTEGEEKEPPGHEKHKVPPGHEAHELPPGQEKKQEGEGDESGETPPPAKAPPPAPPSEGGGTGAPGGISPNSAVGEGN